MSIFRPPCSGWCLESHKNWTPLHTQNDVCRLFRQSYSIFCKWKSYETFFNVVHRQKEHIFMNFFIKSVIHGYTNMSSRFIFWHQRVTPKTSSSYRPPSRLSKFPILLIPFKKEGLRSGNSIYYGNPINSSGAHVLDNLLAVAQQTARHLLLL